MSSAAQIIDEPPLKAGFWQRYVKPPDPRTPNPTWHVSPIIDMAAYHFSWAWLLAPMLWTGPDPYANYLYLFALMMGFNFAHRHYGMPYAYLDGAVFQTYRRRLLWAPLLCLALFAATPLLLHVKIAGSAGALFVETMVFVSLLWNFWHTPMQKYGILRLYMAKSPAALERKTPAWVDRCFVFCWFPLYFTYLGPAYKNLILRNGGPVEHFAAPILSLMETYKSWLQIPSGLAAAVLVTLWVGYEWRAHRFTNRARLSAAAGTLLISTALFWADPIKAYIAYAFSHAAEYMVFVWAYQRRRYRAATGAPSLMRKILARPYRWYAAFTGILMTVGIVETLWGSLFQGPLLLGLTVSTWYFYYAVYESLVHFYMDGFLWKMRKAEVRQNL